MALFRRHCRSEFLQSDKLHLNNCYSMLDLIFLESWALSSRLWHRIVWNKFTDMSDEGRKIYWSSKNLATNWVPHFKGFVWSCLLFCAALWIIQGLTIKFANSPPCDFRGSSGQKHQFGFMTSECQSFTAMLLLIYGSLFLSGVYYCLSVFLCLASRQCTCPHGTAVREF
jgi:hypothetical protein